MTNDLVETATAAHNASPTQPNPSPKRRIVVVLGMHRSGTSLLTNVLNVLGVEVGEDLMPGDKANELGYWENKRIFCVQNTLLNFIAKDWGECGFAYPFAIDWSRMSEFRFYRDALVGAVREEMSAAKALWGFKDPRTCRLLPVWNQVFEELNLEPLYIFAIRDPAVVVDSLLKHHPLDPLHAELVWLLYNVDAIRHAGKEFRLVVDYDRWFTAPLEQAQEVARSLELTWPGDPAQLLGSLTKTIRPDLRRSQAKRRCSLPFVNKLYEALQHTAANGWKPEELENGVFKYASECLAAALELSSETGRIAVAVGQAEFRAENFEASLEAYTRASRLQPKLPCAYSGKAMVLQALGRASEAVDNANKALALDPADGDALKVLARNHLNNHHHEAAEEACRLMEQRGHGAQAIELMHEALVQKEKALKAANNLFKNASAPVARPKIEPAPIFRKLTPQRPGPAQTAAPAAR
jgi:hypothetical protein